MRTAACVLGVCLLVIAGGCEKAETPAPTPAEPAPLPTTIDMGERQIGAFHVHATRDYGDCYPGANLPCTALVTPDEGAPAITAINFWLGYEDPSESLSSIVEAAQLEDDPSRWFAIASIPAPYPDGCELWVEILDETGGRSVGYFDLIK